MTGGDLEDQIAQWRAYLRRRAVMHGTDVAELEDHLRSQVSALTQGGLAADEAFLVAVKRMGSLDAVAREFAREHSERLWKQLVMAEGDAGRSRADGWRVVLLALAAALAVKLPELFGLRLDDAGAPVYLRNASLFVFPLLAAYFGWQRRIGPVTGVWLALALVAGALFANVYPFGADADTAWLSALHLPIALWMVVGIAYAGGWSGGARMDFVRFSGELFIYYVLMALGGGVLAAFTAMMFGVIGLDAERFLGQWLVPCGAAGALVVAAWLVEAKQSVIENMAPVLTRIFTPLFTAVLLAFLATLWWTGNPINVQREVLIAFDLLLVVVVGLVLYAASARDPDAAPGPFDWLQFVLIVSAVAVDAVALAAVAGRISEFGLTPNRIAALGENLILLANLVGSAWLYGGFLRGRSSFALLERWQIFFLPVYCAWAALVVIFFPPWFDYR